MSDTNPRDVELDVALQHGILDEQAVDRRRFLAKLGAAGALGMAYMAFGRDAGAMTDRLERLATPSGAAPRPIYMVALGDSVLWGQGLDESQRFQTKVEKWIEANNPDRRQVKRWNFAHSGATVGSLRGLSSSHSGSGQMTAAVFGRLASANRGRRDMQDVPEFDPRLVRRDSVRTEPRPSGARSDRKPVEPADGDRLGGEIPRTYPTLWRQLDLALETVRTGKDPRFDYGGSTPISPADMDLVLLDGGANDIDFLGTVLNTARGGQATYDYVYGIVYPRMKAFLPTVLAAFPNARIVMNTYYRAISPLSSPVLLGGLVAWAGATAMWNLPPIVRGELSPDHIRNAIDRMDGLERAVVAAYTRVRSEQRDPSRIDIVSPDFGPEHAYGAPRSHIFHVSETDPAERVRHPECDALLGRWFEDIGQTFLDGTTTPRADTPIWLLCRDASTFHPNVAGADRYYQRIRATLEANPPAFMRATPRLRVVVNGTTAGDRKTVTVTAFDPNSGKPVNGTVKVAGVTGRTGAALSFDAACGTTAAAAAAPVEVPVGARGRGKRVVARPGAVKRPPVCSGSVAAPGYLDGSFRY